MPRSTDPTHRTPDAFANIMAALLTVHTATTADALVDAASSAAENGLAASCALIFLEEEDGNLTYQAPSSDLRKRAHRRIADALGTVLFRAPITGGDLPLVTEALDSGTAIAVPLAELLAPLISEDRAAAAAETLGVTLACVAPLETAGERLGALIVFGSALEAARVRLLADHVAAAMLNLRPAQQVAETQDIEFARAVFDARKLASELDRELLRAARYRRGLSLVVIESTNLRLLRERFGRKMTEDLFERLGQSLAQHARDIDLIGAFRESGYTMVLTEANAAGVENAAQRLLAIATSVRADGVPGLELHLAAGYATFPDDGASAESLFAAAQRRMYGAQATRVA